MHTGGCLRSKVNGQALKSDRCGVTRDRDAWPYAQAALYIRHSDVPRRCLFSGTNPIQRQPGPKEHRTFQHSPHFSPKAGSFGHTLLGIKLDLPNVFLS